MRAFKHIDASTIEEAASILAKYKGKAKIIAGGTDLLGIMKDNILPMYPEILVNIKTISGLEYIKEEDGVLKIGALAKLADIAENEIVRANYTALAEACSRVASPHIREMGTLPGNICQHPRCWYYRYPDNFFYCLRKGGGMVWAMIGDNRYHSIFGSVSIPGANPCTQNCPINVEIPSYLNRIRSGDLLGAAKLLLEFNPLASITGRVCPHFCEEKCNRGKFDEPISIKSIERFLGDYALENAAKVIQLPEGEVGKSVAIVGSGPAGLSAAYYLRRFGYDVTIFERMGEPGGLLTYGIPPFRLPKAVVRRLIKVFEDLLGVKFRVNVAVGEKIDLEELMKDFDAVLLASGAWKEASMRIPGEELMMSGLEFLKEINMGIRKAPGKRVAVIGGGNVAVDVSRVLLRLGAEPTILYRRSEAEMPALKEEVETAKNEGVKFEFLTQPIEAREKDGKILLKCIRMKLGPPDETGRPKPIPIEGSEFTVEFDAVIKAIGERPDVSYIPAEFLDEKGRLKLDASTYRLGRNLFAGGDLVTGPSTVAAAIASGKGAAFAIDRYLMGKERFKPREGIWERFRKVNVAYLTKKARISAQELSVSERIKSLDVEDVLGLNLPEVEEEANRCFQCGCIASHPSDTAPALIVLNARVVTNKRVIPIEEFFEVGYMKTTVLDPDEIITEIQVPAPKPGTKSKFMKFALRKSIDFPIVNCASAIRSEGGVVEEARICLNAVCPIPYRAIKAEEYLKGKPIDESTAEEASKRVVEEANPLPMTKYKVHIAKALVKRTILACK